MKPLFTYSSIRLPWFRVHIVILNDPGRLISVHLMHTGQISGWAGSIFLYEALVTDKTDSVFNPVWRQGCYVLPFSSRLGVIESSYGWVQGESLFNSAWAYEIVVLSHLILSGLLLLSSQWHWVYSDLDLFISTTTGNLVLDLNRIFGIHLVLASIVCFSYGSLHLSGVQGPGMWTSDAYGILGSTRGVKPVYSLEALVVSSYGVVTSNHISSGGLGIVVSARYISTRPQPSLYRFVSMGNLETILASSISSVFFLGFITSSTMWYASVTTPIELFGPSRYQWDNAYFALDLGSRVNTSSLPLKQSWDQIPDKLTLYDYIGCNPKRRSIQGRPHEQRRRGCSELVRSLILRDGVSLFDS